MFSARSQQRPQFDPAIILYLSYSSPLSPAEWHIRSPLPLQHLSPIQLPIPSNPSLLSRHHNNTMLLPTLRNLHSMPPPRNLRLVVMTVYPAKSSSSLVAKHPPHLSLQSPHRVSPPSNPAESELGSAYRFATQPATMTSSFVTGLLQGVSKMTMSLQDSTRGSRWSIILSASMSK